MAGVVKKGEVIWTEIPLFTVQAYDNRQTCICCYYCGKFLGKNADMVRNMDTRRRRAISAVSNNDYCIPCVHNLEASADDNKCSRNKCSSVYCSSDCRDNDICLRGHNFICTNGGERSLMAQFFKFAASQQQVIGDDKRAQLDYNFVYAAEITAQLICTARISYMQQSAGSGGQQRVGVSFITHLKAVVDKYFSVFYGQLGSAMSETGSYKVPVYYRDASYMPDSVAAGSTKVSVRLQSEVEQQCDESWYLFSSALLLEKRCFSFDASGNVDMSSTATASEDVFSVLNTDFWVRLLSTIDLYFLPISVQSPLIAAVESLRTIKSRKEKRRLYGELTNNRAVRSEVDIANRPVCTFVPAKYPPPLPQSSIPCQFAGGCNIVLPRACVDCKDDDGAGTETGADPNKEAEADGQQSDCCDDNSAIVLDRAVELLIQQALYMGAPETETDTAGANADSSFSANPFSNPYASANYVGIALVPSACGRPHTSSASEVSTIPPPAYVNVSLSHSCVPSVVMDAVVEQQEPFRVTCQFTALRDIHGLSSNQLSMCFIAHNEEDVESRNNQLHRKTFLKGQFGVVQASGGADSSSSKSAEMNFVDTTIDNSIICRCERCVYEYNNYCCDANATEVAANGNTTALSTPSISTSAISNASVSAGGAADGSGSAPTLSYESLLSVAYQAMQELRYEEAARLLVDMIYSMLSELGARLEDRSPDGKAGSDLKAVWEMLTVLREAVHALGACCLEAGFWEQAHVIWTLGHRWLHKIRARAEYMETLCSACITSATSTGLLSVGHLLDSQYIKDGIYRNVLPGTGANATAGKESVSSSRFDKISSLDYHHCVRIALPRTPGTALAAASVASSPGIYISSIPLLSPQQCDSIVQAAEDHIAVTNGGKWFTSRHYSVPTTDIPAHTIPALQSWFCRDIVVDIIKPLILRQYREQFTATETVTTTVVDGSNDTQYPNELCADDVLIHDLFIVKYEARSDSDSDSDSITDDQVTQNSLPLHFDQSSHSFVIALSDNCFADNTRQYSSHGDDGDDGGNNTAAPIRYTGGGTFFPALCGSGIDVVPNTCQYGNNNGTGTDATGAQTPAQYGVNGVCAHKGHICTFAGGDVLHAGETVLKGIRYILAGFVYLRTGKGPAGKGKGNGKAQGCVPMLDPAKEFISCLSSESSLLDATASSDSSTQSLRIPACISSSSVHTAVIFSNSLLPKSCKTSNRSSTMLGAGKRTRNDDDNNDNDNDNGGDGDGEGNKSKEFKFSFDDFFND